MNHPTYRTGIDTRGSALLIVLAFLLLLTTLTVAFLSRATFERQLSNASFSQGKVDLAGQGAIGTIISDLQQEIVAGSTGGTGTPTMASGYLYPNSPLTAIPQPVVPINSFNYTPSSIVGSGMENLIKISQRGTTFWSGSNYSPSTGPPRAASVSTTTASLNGRSITSVRWNDPLLMAPTLSSATDFSPPSAFQSNPPDWIYIARDGSNPTSTTLDSSYISSPGVSPTATPTKGTLGTNPVTQRYAYAIYDEGGALDMNVAGSPISTAGAAPYIGSYSPNQPYKNALAYADLLQLPYNATTSLATQLTTAQKEDFVNAIVGWRNFGSSNLTASYLFPNTNPFNYVTTTTPPSGTVANYDNNILFNTSGFMTVGGFFSTSALGLGKGPPGTTGTANQSDNAFGSRQQLLQFVLQGLGQNSTFLTNTGLTLSKLESLLPYMGTFSRDISQPSYAPNPGRPVVLPTANGGNSAVGADPTVNPAFLATTVGASFTRNDGTSAIKGEPLVKKRFALNRLAWITYMGPSATRTQYALGAASPGVGTANYDMWALVNLYGISPALIAQGTAANIQKYFGLDYVSGSQWKYDYHNSGGAPATGSSGPIMQLGAIAALGANAHDPDFFELLKATIGVGSIGKALSYSNSAITVAAADSALVTSQSEIPYNYNYYPEYSVDYQILQIGANMIAQFQPANLAPQIVFDDGHGNPNDASDVPRTIVGVENLPYLSMVTNGVVQLQAPATTNPTQAQYATGTALTASTTIQNSGIGGWMQEPVIWNPHDPSSSTGTIGPTSIRVVATSGTPSGQTTSKFFVYGASVGLGSPSLTNFSNNAVTSSDYTGTTATYVDTGNGQTIAHQFKVSSTLGASDAEIDLTVSGNPSKEFCPEPVILMKHAGITDSNGNSITVTEGSSSWMHSDPAVAGVVTATGLPDIDTTLPYTGATGPYIGFYLGAFPWVWTPATSAIVCETSQSGARLARAGGTNGATPAGSQYSCYMTYQMQYKDPNTGNWVTYDTKYGQAYGSGSGCGNGDNGSQFTLLGNSDWGFATDPRSSRFGLLWNGSSTGNNAMSYGDALVQPSQIARPLPEPSINVANEAADWLDTANGIIYTLRPDADAGFYSLHGWPAAIGPTSGWMAYVATNANAAEGLAPGLLSQNNTDIFYMPFAFYGGTQGSGTYAPNYFADADGMVRRAMGANVPPGSSNNSPPEGAPISAATTVGLPMARVFGWSSNPYPSPAPSSPDPTITTYPGVVPTSLAPTSQAQSRPYFLHRPFYSVAELGYVFSDTPWRNLDFFTAESGNAALLDAFCINDTNDPGGLVAGKVDLNTRQSAVLQAVIGGGCLDSPNALAGTGTVRQVNSTTAGLVAQALVARTTDTANVANGTGPLQNINELVGKWVKNTAINDLGSVITGGVDKGTLASGNGFYDGKLSYAGFSGGVWDTTNHKPYVNGIENFSSGTPTAASNGTTEGFTYNAEDVYSAYMDDTISFSAGSENNGTQQTAGYIQRFREAPIRALAAAGTARVWNLMIDVIAQTGRFPSSASTLANFNVEGERRYWVHVAIDRYTGKVLDEQVEEVKE
jgi:hypothetical protein